MGASVASLLKEQTTPRKGRFVKSGLVVEMYTEDMGAPGGLGIGFLKPMSTLDC